MVFLGSSCRETAKNAIKQSRWENTTGKRFFFSQLFRPKVFDMDFPQKVFYSAFELPLLRNAQKRHKKKKNKKKKGTMVPDLSSARYTSLSFFFFSAPLVLVLVLLTLALPTTVDGRWQAARGSPL
jgi:hypothetical protein